MLLVTAGWIFFLCLSPEEAWIPGGMQCNPISPGYPPSCFAVNPQLPSVCPSWGRLCFPGLRACLCRRCFCWGVGLLSCQVKPLVTSLFLYLSPEDALEPVRATRCCHTRIYNESCVSARCLCKTCTRFHQEVTESFPWEAAMGEGFKRFRLRGDSSKNCSFFKAEGRSCPEWGGCDPSPDPPCSPFRSPRSSLWWSQRARAAPGAWLSLWTSEAISSCHRTEKHFRASRGCSQPPVTLGCYWVLLPFCFILFTI